MFARRAPTPTVAQARDELGDAHTSGSNRKMGLARLLVKTTLTQTGPADFVIGTSLSRPAKCPTQVRAHQARPVGASPCANPAHVGDGPRILTPGRRRERELRKRIARQGARSSVEFPVTIPQLGD
jgi:hypothetical protein